MILSASRRTDIPAFYGEWFMNRIKAGFVCVRNPFNKNMVSKIAINKDVLDCIVFWTKDAAPFIKYLDELDANGFKYYFQFTITPYDKDIEPSLRNKQDIIQTFIELSNKIGKERVIWRYDPIFLTESISIDWHISKFTKMCKKLAGYTNEVIISFLDNYSKIKNRGLHTPDFNEMQALGKKFLAIACKFNLKLKTCAESIDICGIEKGSCIDKNLIEKICGYELDAKKDKTQRKECLCAESIDIGEYNTCTHFCKYCYANQLDKDIRLKLKSHNDNSPLLIGNIKDSDMIYERNINSLRKK